VRVERVPASVTYPLRQQVLRPYQDLADLVLPGDDDPSSAHVAVRDDGGRVVATGTVRREAPPWAPGRGDAWRLRGMATAPGHRGRGVGAAVLAELLDHVAGHGGGLVWCNARLPARRFYERAGFVVRGDEWDDPDIGPHVAMHRDLPPR
jgi:GNAT superfamily N-acetyltransferase